MDDHTPLVSIIVLNWNRRALTALCLDALRAQSFQGVEVIVVDNGSGDGSAAFLAQQYPEVNVIALPENLGFCGGNNAGIRQARGEYVALLNNDTEVDPRWLEELVRAISTRPDVGFCASKMVLHDRPELLDTAGDSFCIAGTSFKRGHLDRADRPRYNRPREVFSACAGAALYRRSMLNDIGLLDEDFFITQEDVDLGFRARLRGYTCVYVPTAVVRHRLNATLNAYSPEYVYYGHRNLEYVYLKNLPLPWLLLTLPFHSLDMIMAFLFFLCIGRGGDFLRAKRDALKALRTLLVKRRVIQQSRTMGWRQFGVWLEWQWFLPKVRALWRQLNAHRAIGMAEEQQP